MDELKATVFNIQKFSVNDGPGIRTTVFLKGCMLDCRWCHNPESKSPLPQLFLTPRLCIGCGECVRACPAGLHSFTEEGQHQIDRRRCTRCGKCVDACVGALEMSGREMTTSEVLVEVMKDKCFYDNSGGGMTVSGGEPLFRYEFTLELLKKARERGLHTCIETSGFAPWEEIESLIPFVDIFLWDVKETDGDRHLEYTGVPNDMILENLRRLSGRGASVILRCPLIPGFNDRPEHLAAIAALAEELDGVTEVNVEPYHPLGKSKSDAIGESYQMGDLSFPEEETVKGWIAAIASATTKTVKKA